MIGDEVVQAAGSHEAVLPAGTGAVGRDVQHAPAPGRGRESGGVPKRRFAASSKIKRCSPSCI